MSDPSVDGLDPSRPPSVPPPLPSEPSWEPEWEPERPRAKKSRRTLWIVLIFLGVPVLLVLGLVALGGLYLLSASDMPVLPSDREVVVTREYLEEWFDIATEERHESFTKTRYIDQSWELMYEYEDDGVYLDTTVSVEPTRGDAVAVYVAMGTSARVGIKALGGADLAERNDLLSWGERSKCYIMSSEGAPFGNFFICLDGKKVFYFALSGCYFDEPGAFRQFLSPVLGKLRGYSPSP